MTENQEKVLEYLKSARGPSFRTPTEIGMALGKSYYGASRWACKILKTLVKQKLVQKSKTLKGRYKASNKRLGM